jgi:putative PIN family toxin of toxin-antitoxin system
MKAAKRVVVDTNTIISGILLPESVPGRLLAHLVENATVIFSAATRDELLEVTAREKFDRYVPPEARERSVSLVLQAAEFVAPTRVFRVCRDAKDDKFLDAACASKVDCLVSGDADLGTLGVFGRAVLSQLSVPLGAVSRA